MGAVSLRGLFLLQSATGTQFNFATVRNNRGPLAICVRFDRSGNRTRSPAQESPLKPDSSAIQQSRRSKTKSFFMTSRVRRILKRGTRNLRKFEKNKGRNEHCFTQI